MKKILLLFLFIPLFCLAQTKTVSQWQTDFDAVIYGPYSVNGVSGLSGWTGSALKSHSGTDMYFEGYNMIIGLTKAWQATGDFKYLDLALDIVQQDVEGATDLQAYFSTYPNGKLGTLPSYLKFNLPFSGNIIHQNYFEATYAYVWPNNYWQPNKGEYINTAADDGIYNQYSYYGMSANPNNYPGQLDHLTTGIYYRFAIDIVRIIYNNDVAGSILNETSNNGQTYQQRCDIITTFIEQQFVDMWKDTSGANPTAYWYRVNTHMSSHNASICLSLYAITGNSEYLTEVNRFLYDWGEATNSNAPDGIGFLDQLRLEDIDVDTQNGYYWANGWGDNSSYTDSSHFLAELHFLTQCIDEGIGLSPPNSEPIINQTLIDYVNEMMIEGFMRGYECADGANTSGLSYYINAGAQNGPMTGATTLWGIYEPSILCYNEQYDNYDLNEIGIRGVSMYVAAVLESGGSSLPVYPSDGTGGATPPVNNAPTVSLVGSATVNVVKNNTYTELGATWTDQEDGSGTISTPTTGSVNTAVIGDYVLTYTYTDAGSLSNSKTRTVTVSDIPNDCPVVTLTGASGIVIEKNSAYTELGAGWTDVQDGSGTITTPTTGSVNNAVVGDYILTYTYTDVYGCSDTKTRTVTVEDTTGNVLFTNISFDNAFETVAISEGIIPAITKTPTEPTLPYLWIQVDDYRYAYTDPNGYIIGTVNGRLIASATTLDGSNITKYILIKVGTGIAKSDALRKTKTRKLIARR